MATYIHGIGASENIDSSGEIVSIAGLDISSLDKDGVFNYEHKSDVPAQVVGKILKAKKIFSDADCDDDHQLYFWNKTKVPYLYVMGELLDDYSDSAREVAARFKYDLDHKNQNERAMMNFSVEGSKISKEGIIVTRSIARKITITILPCNKAAVAEMVAVDPAKPKKNEIDELFKTEATEIEIVVPREGSKLWDLLKKEDPARHAAKLGINPMKKDAYGAQTPSQSSAAATPGGLGNIGPTSSGGVIGGEGMMRSELEKASPKLSLVGQGAKPADHARGNQIGVTSAGHGVFSHGMVGEYTHFGANDHMEAAKAHQAMSDASKDFKMKQHHHNKAKLHAALGQKMQVASQQRAAQQRGQQMTPQTSSGAAAPTGPQTLSGPSTLHHPEMSGKIKPPGPQQKSESIKKALDAGSALTSPANLTGGAALGKEDLDKSAATTVMMQKDSKDPSLAPKDRKIKELQTKIDTGTYKPDTKKIAEAMLPKPKPMKKSAWLMRAEHDYNHWEKREAFESFMQRRMPHLTKGEIRVLGQTMLMQKAIEMENNLNKMFGAGNNPVNGGGSYVAKAITGIKQPHPKDPVIGPNRQAKPATEEYKAKALAYLEAQKQKKK